MKSLVSLLSFCFLLTIGQLTAATFKTYGNVQVQKTEQGTYLATILPDKGWPQIHFNVPFGTWGKGQIRLSVKQIQPEKKLPVQISVGTSPVRANALKGGYITQDLKLGETVSFLFQETGTQAPDAIVVSAKHPEEKVVLELTLPQKVLKDGKQTGKVRLPSLPAIRFHGKPFFPIGAYDMHSVGTNWSDLDVDEDFLEAGGNFSDFGVISMPYKLFYYHGQPAIFKGLEKMRKDPRFKNVAVLVQIGINMALDDSQVKGGRPGHGNYYIPVTGKALEAHQKELTETVKKLRNHPNVIGYTLDEPENMVWGYYDRNFKKEWKTQKDSHLIVQMKRWLGWIWPIIRTHHPEAKLMPIMAWWTTYKDCGDMYDAIIVNTYPRVVDEELTGNLFEVSYDAAMAVEAARYNGNGKTAIFMPPMYDQLGDLKHGMTLREQRYLNFAPITRGCMGIHGWRLQRASSDYRKSVIFPAIREVSKLSQFFLGTWHDELVQSDHDTASVDYLRKFKVRVRLMEGLEDADTVEVDGVPDCTYCLRRHEDGRYLLLVVNNRKEPLKVNFQLQLKGLPKTMRDVLDKHHVAIDQERGTFKDTFAPFDVHAYIFRTNP